MKENNGRGARQKFWKRCFAFTVLACLCYGGVVINDVRSKKRGRKTFLGRLFRGRRNRFSTKRVRALLPENKKEYEPILSAKLNLVDIDTDRRKLRGAPEDSYDGVYGTFCKINWKVHKEDPSSVPMFRFLQQKSPQCRESNLVRAPLKEIADLARDLDEQNDRSPTSPEVPKPLNFTGIVFHESRCGSTLVANTLIGMNPEKHRVYSESPPPITAMKVCGEDFEWCSIDQAAAVLQDVLYLMGRTNDPQEERVFFKIQSVGSRSIEVFRRAFPTTPWLFVYRDPVQVMMSHFKLGTTHANCMRSYSNPPKLTRQFIKKKGGGGLFGGGASKLSPEDFCAAHLGALTDTALQSAQRSNGVGLVVNYDTLPQSLYETILPEKFGVPTGPQEIERIQTIAGTYSKGKGEKIEWKEDSTRKEEAASEEVKKAAETFMQDSYNDLQKVSIKKKS